MINDKLVEKRVKMYVQFLTEYQKKVVGLFDEDGIDPVPKKHESIPSYLVDRLRALQVLP
jgi:hypothetical protein